MMRKNLWVIIFALMVAPAFAQKVQVVSLPKYLASSLYSFVRFINWPDENKTGDFVIAVVGNNEVFQELSTLSGGKTVGSQPIQIKFYKKIDELNGYHHVVFLGGTSGVPINKLTKKTEGQRTLLVTECQGMLSWGSAINFVEKDGFMKFEMSKTAMLSKGLQVSSQL